MSEVGIRALKQNASAVVADASGGETITVTDRVGAVAQLTAIPASRLAQLIAAGRVRAPRQDITALPSPDSRPGLTAELTTMRAADRS